MRDMYFQLGFPSRYTLEDNEEGNAEAARLVKQFNGLTKVFRSIYNYDGVPCADTAVIDKIFFDFDYDEDQPNKAQKDLQKLHNFLKQEEYAHSIYFSGMGFHLFLETEVKKAREFMSPALVVRGVHKHICATVGIEPDEKTKDLMRFARLPGTKNLKSKFFCIPLSEEMIHWSREEIMNRAKEQHFEDFRINGKPYCLDDFDVEKTTVKYAEPVGNIEDIQDEILEDMPYCVRNLLLGDYCGWTGRRVVITAMKEKAYTREETVSVLEKYLSSNRHKLDGNEYEHCMKENQVDYLFDNPDMMFPACFTNREDGFCVEGCEGPKIYLE